MSSDTLNSTTFKIMSWFSVFFILFLLAFSAASLALFYYAETERLSTTKAKNMRIASICVVVICILALAFISIWVLADYRERYMDLLVKGF